MTAELFYIWSMEHNAWWRVGSMGYTHKLSEAGTYNRADADKILYNANYGAIRAGTPPNEAMIPVALCQVPATPASVPRG